MRPYRGLTIETKRRAYGWYCKVKGKHYIILDDAEMKPIDPDMGGWGDGIYGFVEVDPETVGQSTGLKDKNSKETYAGDLNQLLPNGPVCEVQWQQKYCRWIHYWNDDKDGSSYVLLVEGKYLNVGNIHENPELLEEKK